MIIIIKIILLLVLLGMSAFFSGSETAFFSLSRFDIQRMNAKNLPGASRATSLLHNPSRLLVTILVGNTLVNVSATTLMTGTLLDIVGAGAVPIAVAIMIILILIFGEITPKVFAVEHNNTWARFGSPFLSLVIVATLPLTYMLHLIQGVFLKGTFRDDIRLGEVDLQSALELALRKGAIGQQARDLLLHFLDLERITAEEITRPIEKIPIISGETSCEDALRRICESHIDYAFVGGLREVPYFLVEQDSLALTDSGDLVKECAEKAIVVQKNTTLAALFQQLYGDKYRHIVVTDDKKRAIGVAAREDILSGIFLAPLIKDKPSLKELSRVGRFYIVNGDMPLENFNEIFDTEIGISDRKSIGNFLVEKFGTLGRGESVEFGNFNFRIIRSHGDVIERIAVKKS